MHCDCCDVLLTDEESRIRLRSSGEFANTCRKCLDSSGLSYKLPKPHYEEDLVKDVVDELPESSPFDEEYWNER